MKQQKWSPRQRFPLLWPHDPPNIRVQLLQGRDKRHAFLSFALHKIPVRQSWAFPKNMFFTSFVILLSACCEWENNLLHWPPSWWSLHYQLRSITLAASKVHVALWSFPLLTYMCDTTELMWHVYSIDARIQNMTKNGAQPSMTE